MLRKHLVGAVAAALGLAVAAQVAAVTPRNIHAGRLGRIHTTTLARHLHLEAGNSFLAGKKISIRSI